MILTDGLDALQPVTAIFVVCLICLPFWAVMIVGIARCCPHMLPFAFAGRLAPRIECGPSGRLVSNRLIGASGTVSKRE